MVGDGNKVGELYVDIVGNTTKVDAAVAEVKAKAGAGGGNTTEAEGQLHSLGRAGKFVKEVMNKIVLPASVAVAVVRVVGYFQNLQVEAIKAGESIRDIGRAALEAAAKAQKLSMLQSRVDRGELRKSALEVEKINQQTSDTLQKIETERAAKVAELESKNVSERIAMAWAGQSVDEQIQQIEDAALKAKTDAEMAAQIAIKDAKRNEIEDAARVEVETAKKASREAQAATLEGDDLINFNRRKAIEDLNEKFERAGSDAEKKAIQDQAKAVNTKADAEIAAALKVRKEKDAQEGEALVETLERIKKEAQARADAISDFNKQAKAAVNDLLKTGGIETGLSQIVGILQSIKSSQGNL